MKIIKNNIFLILMVLLFTNESLATNGYFSHGYGIRYKMMAGTGAALYYSSLGVATNPASIAYLSKRYDIGLTLFNPNREFTVTGNPSGFPGTFGLAPVPTESDKSLFFIPELGGVWKFGEDNTLGVAIYGNGGMNTEYNTSPAIFGGSSPVGVNLSQLFVNISYARQFIENHSIGASIILAGQFFEAQGLEAFQNFSSNPTKVTNNKTDTGFGVGFKIGYQGEPAEGFRIGASYQSKIFMSEFDDYAGLFAEQGDFDIPATWTAGIAYTFNETFTAAVDIQQILYSDIKSVANPITNLLILNSPMGADDGPGFGWRDMTILKLGVEYSGLESWKIRGGYSFALDDQPIPSTEMNFNILAPGVIESHASLGFSKMIGENELSLAVTHAFSNSVTGPNMMEAPGQQTIELKMDQWDIGIGFSF